MLQLKDQSGLLSAISESWRITSGEIEAAMTAAIVAEIYNWPNRTVRQNGEIATSPRDIVDTGQLKNSQQSTVIGDNEVEISWNTEYATLVHEGINNLPPRRWTQKAIRGDHSAPLEWQDSEAILNVPARFIAVFRSFYYDSRRSI